MSTNPDTKTYRSRIKRISKELRFAAGFRWRPTSLAELQEIVQEMDPGMTPKMLADAIKLAIRDSEDHLTFAEEEIERNRKTIAALQELQALQRKPKLVLVKGKPL